MPWTKNHPRTPGELEFHFANEVGKADEEKVRKALARHDRRHPDG